MSTWCHHVVSLQDRNREITEVRCEDVADHDDKHYAHLIGDDNGLIVVRIEWDHKK